MKNILIFGTGGHAKVIIDIVEQQQKYKIIGLIDERIGKYSSGKNNIHGYSILGGMASLKDLTHSYKIYGGIIGQGDNAKRLVSRNIINNSVPNFNFVNCIHPNSTFGKEVKLGHGNVIMAGVIINSSSIITDHCILNTNSSIDHDCVMSEFSSIAPNVSLGGNVKIGNRTAVGIGTNIFHNIEVGNNCIIGGGSIVVKNTKDNSVYYGSPSIFIREHKFGDKYL